MWNERGDVRRALHKNGVDLPGMANLRATVQLAGWVFLALSLVSGEARAQCATSITGTVYAPNGVDPLPNILVFVPVPGATLPTFSNGVDSVNGCSTSGNLVPATTTAATITDSHGNFTLTNANLAGAQTLVIQAGKWRRQYANVTVNACQTNAAPQLQMPSNSTQGDLPRIAVDTGNSDAIECIFRKIGISDTEFTSPKNPTPGHIQLYRSLSGQGVDEDASALYLPADSVLVGTPATLNSYDMVMFGCQGSTAQVTSAVAANQNNLASYANLGGRIFATHFSSVWLQSNPEFNALANWIPNQALNMSLTIPSYATINQSFAEGGILSDWLQYIGATTTPGQMPLYQTNANQSGVNFPSQSWATLDDAAHGNPTMQFTADTPVSATTAPVGVMSFANTPTTFGLGDTGDTITVNVTNTGTASADMTLTLTLTLPTGLTAQSLIGEAANTGWACSRATLVCNRTSPLKSGDSDAVQLKVSVSLNAPLGQGTVASVLTGGGLSGTNRCGRVMYTDYHTERIAASYHQFPQECTGGIMTPQEKFLEFSLYNLSSFIAPSTTDAIDILANPVLIWPTPAPIVYGTLLSSAQLNATASLPGTFVYTPAAGAKEPIGSDTLSVTFFPANVTEYAPATATVQLQVNSVPTTTSLAVCVPGSNAFPCPSVAGALPPVISLVNEYFGQSYLASAVPVAADASTLSGTGTVTVYDLYNSVSAAVCTFPISTPACPPTAGATLALGTHAFTSVYAGDTAHASSTSNSVTVNVMQDVSSVTLTSSADPALVGQAVTFTATVTGNYANPGSGTVTFYDGSSVLGTATLTGTNAATFTTSSLTLGTHQIAASYAATTNFGPATSGQLAEVIVAPAAALGTAISLTSSLNPAPLGLRVVFTAAVTTVGPFTVIPTGTVTFLDGTTVLGTKTLDGTGSATFSTSSLKVGMHSMTASYAGSPATTAPPKPGPVPVKGKAVPSGAFTSGLAASVSAVLPQVITTLSASQPTGFTLTAGPSPVTVGAGEYATLQVQVLQFSGFYQPVSLGCSGLPAMMSCVFQTTTIGSGGGSTVLYVIPQGPETCGTPPTPYYSSNRIPWLPLGGPLVAGLGLLVSPKRRRRWSSLLGLAMVTAAMTMVSGCGTCTNLGIQPGSSYTFTLTATQVSGGTAAQSVPITVHVVMP